MHVPSPKICVVAQLSMPDPNCLHASVLYKSDHMW